MAFHILGCGSTLSGHDSTRRDQIEYPGRGHINCRPHEEWIGWFEQLGWRRDEERTQQVRSDLEALGIAHWLRTKSLVFRPVAQGGIGFGFHLWAMVESGWSRPARSGKPLLHRSVLPD
jgi:hypothetical protein